MSGATESSVSYLSNKVDRSYETIYPRSHPSEPDNRESSSDPLEKTGIDALSNKKTVVTEKLVPTGIDEEKAGFIRWLLPQIEQAREEIGHLLSTNVPNSLVLAMAALESGWGTSFGAKNRQNLFGLTKANGQYMRFSSSIDGLKKYMITLDQHRAYRPLRVQLGRTTNSLELTKYLVNYCNCSGYPDKLNKIIRGNNLATLDQ